MSTLLLRLGGPMQSWGTTSRFDERDSQLEPSKSGVLGLLCAALGRDRSEPLDDLAALRMGVRVDREGVLMRDFQTATGLVSAEGTVKRDRTVVSPRYFLSDAVFLIGLEGENDELLKAVDAALRAPRWPLALGRKGYVPSVPVWTEAGIQAGGLREALIAFPRIAESRFEDRSAGVRLVLESPRDAAMRMDQPIGPFSTRQFGPRRIVTEVVHVPE